MTLVLWIPGSAPAQSERPGQASIIHKIKYSSERQEMTVNSSRILTLDSKIPQFQAADKAWVAEARESQTKAALVAGKEYTKIFADVAKLDARWAAARAKDKKISGRNGRAKAEARTKATFERKLKTQAGKLQKLAKKHPDTYYGRAANESLKGYETSNGAKLTDQRGK